MFDKILRVISSCETKAQLRIAHKYALLYIYKDNTSEHKAMLVLDFLYDKDTELTNKDA